MAGGGGGGSSMADQGRWRSPCFSLPDAWDHALLLCFEAHGCQCGKRMLDLPPRACDDYWAEWKHCKSILNLFHNYYTYGEAPSCTQWKRDYENCREWEKMKSAAAKEALCKSERERVAEKQKHAPVWNLRKSPPMDWYLPLDGEKPK